MATYQQYSTLVKTRGGIHTRIYFVKSNGSITTCSLEGEKTLFSKYGGSRSQGVSVISTNTGNFTTNIPIIDMGDVGSFSFSKNDINPLTNYLFRDDESCILNRVEKEQPKIKGIQGMGAFLPAIASSMHSLPSGYGVDATAIPEIIEQIDEYQKSKGLENITPEENTKISTGIIEDTVIKKMEYMKPSTSSNTGTDTDLKEDEESLPLLPDLSDTETLERDSMKGAKGVFPFCVPWDLMHLVSVLDAEPEAPRFELPFVVPALDFEYTFVIDFAKFEFLAKIVRTGETLFFILSLILISRNIIKG